MEEKRPLARTRHTQPKSHAASREGSGHHGEQLNTEFVNEVQVTKFSVIGNQKSNKPTTSPASTKGFAKVQTNQDRTQAKEKFVLDTYFTCL
ncbi:hypothetical protein ACTXT7_010375 [Hymenolepis weldensis]